MKELEINATAEAELLVAPADLASALSLEAGDSYPPVFSTSRMVALMEIAASRVLRPLHCTCGTASPSAKTCWS